MFFLFYAIPKDQAAHGAAGETKSELKRGRERGEICGRSDCRATNMDFGSDGAGDTQTEKGEMGRCGGMASR